MPLVRLLPSQVSRYWTLIRDGIKLSLPPTVEGLEVDYEAILKNLLCENMSCWMAVDKQGKIIGGVLTTFLVDELCGGAKGLLIYSIFGIREVPTSLWEEGLHVLRDFALNHECKRILFYIDDDKIKSIAKRLGAEFRIFGRILL